MATTEEAAITAKARFEHLSLIRDSRTNLVKLVETRHLSKLLKD